MIEIGSHVTVRDVSGVEMPRIAASAPKSGEDFPVVWVSRESEWDLALAENREPVSVPWPREDVRVEASA